MKKLLFIITLTLLGITICTAPVFATSNILFSPTNINIKEGQNFILTVTVDPNDTKDYTVKLEVNYPPDLLEVKSFTFADNWIPLSQEEYSYIDNKNGVLVKTAGYPNGITSKTNFGDILFLAKKDGNASILVTDNSFILDSTNQNVISNNLAQASLTITGLEPSQSTSSENSQLGTSSIPTKNSLTDEENESQKEESSITEKKESPTPKIVKETETKTKFLANVNSIITLGTNKGWTGFLVGIIFSIIVMYGIRYFKKKKRRD